MRVPQARATTDRLIWLWQHATTPTPDQPRLHAGYIQAYSDELHTFSASFGITRQDHVEDLAKAIHLLVAPLAATYNRLGITPDPRLDVTPEQEVDA